MTRCSDRGAHHISRDGGIPTLTILVSACVAIRGCFTRPTVYTRGTGERARLRFVLLRDLELWIAVGIDGDGDEIRPAAYCTVLGVDLPRAATGIHEGVVLLAAERARVGHGFSG